MLTLLLLFLTTVLGGADESLISNVELHQILTPSQKSEQWINLKTEANTENECNFGSYECRLACVNDGICYRNDSNNLRFFLVGDTGGLPIYPYTTYAQKLVAKSLATIGDEKSVHFTVSAGDNIYFTGVKNEFDQRFQETFENVYKGKALQKPWYLIAGNHDHFGNISGQIAYTSRSQRWTYPANYYKVSYAFGKNATLVEFLMTDTILLCGNTRDITEANFVDMILATTNKNPNTPKDPVAAKAELDWIEQQLSRSRADYLFVVGHYPVYSISEHGSLNCLIEKLKPLLEKYHVTAYVAGHDHTLQHIVTEYSLSENAEKIPLHYVISGAASRSDRSVKHIDTVPQGSLHFNYPTGFNPFSQIGFSNGGFIYVDMDSEKAMFTFYNGKGKEKYSCTIIPRGKFTMNETKK
uniref:Tartrate-resistant acid phosphatase type 5 n=2 Tax=Wuchereria bancrofti TaxID=6293 RepID=A0AAF5Q003_WUCBA